MKTNKSDYTDAEAIAEAVGRPTMRFYCPHEDLCGWCRRPKPAKLVYILTVHVASTLISKRVHWTVTLLICCVFPGFAASSFKVGKTTRDEVERKLGARMLRCVTREA